MDAAALIALLKHDCRLVVLQSTTSTNDEVRERIKVDNTKPPYVVVSIQQTKGRGQQGKTWISPQGGLYLSLQVNLPKGTPMETSVHLTQIVAIAVKEALDPLSAEPLAIKRPNDILTPGGKLVGILVEGTQEGFIVGIGVNVHEPEKGGFSGASYLLSKSSDATNQRATTAAPSLEEVAAAVANSVYDCVDEWMRVNLEFSHFEARYESYLVAEIR